MTQKIKITKEMRQQLWAIFKVASYNVTHSAEGTLGDVGNTDNGGIWIGVRRNQNAIHTDRLSDVTYPGLMAAELEKLGLKPSRVIDASQGFGTSDLKRFFFEDIDAARIEAAYQQALPILKEVDQTDLAQLVESTVKNSILPFIPQRRSGKPEDAERAAVVLAAAAAAIEEVRKELGLSTSHADKQTGRRAAATAPRGKGA